MTGEKKNRQQLKKTRSKRGEGGLGGVCGFEKREAPEEWERSLGGGRVRYVRPKKEKGNLSRGYV